MTAPVTPDLDHMRAINAALTALMAALSSGDRQAIGEAERALADLLGL